MNTPEYITLDQIKQKCRKAIELSEKATEGPWKVSNYRPYQIIARDPDESTYNKGDDKFPVLVYPNKGGDADHITYSRTFSPLAAKALLLAIEQLEDMQKGFMCSQSREALAAICAQFKP